MLPRQHCKRKNRLSKTTIMAIRNLVKKGSDLDIEDFIYDVAMRYIGEVRDVDFVDPKDYLKVTDKKWVFECPNCGMESELMLDEFTEEKIGELK